jgi:hypothetical protein
VKRKPLSNLPASVGDRLRAITKKQREQLQNVLSRYGLERWLYLMLLPVRGPGQSPGRGDAIDPLPEPVADDRSE